jgi:hypothetical protein
MMMHKPSKPKSKDVWTNSEMEEAIRSVPYIDRVWILTVSIIEDKSKDPVGAALGLIECAARITSFLSKEKRFRIAERLRSAADRCEVTSAYADETGAAP